jgi:hypothetical protein
LNQFININDGFEPIQQAEIDRLNQAIKNGNITTADETMMRRKFFNPQTGELTLLVGNNTNDGIRMASVNLFE